MGSEEREREKRGRWEGREVRVSCLREEWEEIRQRIEQTFRYEGERERDCLQRERRGEREREEEEEERRRESGGRRGRRRGRREKREKRRERRGEMVCWSGRM